VSFPDGQRSEIRVEVLPRNLPRAWDRKVFSSAYHPQTNGQVEIFNRTILNSLRGYVSERQDYWDEYTSALTFAYNCRIHTYLRLDPFELVLSRPPATLAVESPESGSDNPPSTVKLKFLEQLQGLLLMARRQLENAQDRYKRNEDRRVLQKKSSLSEVCTKRGTRAKRESET
jgi:hypothetical protein